MKHRKAMLRIVTFLGGIYFFLYFLLPESIGGVPSAEDPTLKEGGFQFGLYHEHISNGFVLIGQMAFGLGLINLLMVHGSQLLYLRSGWFSSLALLIGLVVMLTLSILDWMASERSAAEVGRAGMLRDFSRVIESDHKAGKPGVPELQIRLSKLAESARAHLAVVETELAKSSNREDVSARELQSSLENARKNLAAFETAADAAPDETQRLAAGVALGNSLSSVGVSHRAFRAREYSQTLLRRLYNLVFDGMFVALGAAMFSLLGFYIAAAAYRAFRIRSVESALMMAAAFLVMLGQIPFGLWISESLPDVRFWLLRVPSAAAGRAIDLGASLAGLVLAFRMWLSIESESFDTRRAQGGSNG